MASDLSDLHLALERNQIVPCFQPLVELRTGRITGFEVLARWQRSDQDLTLPPNFISLAEQNGLIGAFTQQVFGKAFLSVASLPEPPALSVNISPVQMSYLTLPGQVRDLAKENGFPLHRLTLEITESSFFNNLDRAKKISKELKEMGCRLSLDDFGTGTSNLGHLQELAFDELKIDRSFVSKMAGTRASRKIVAAIIGLGQSLSMATVAEGIETEEQADMLLCLGCELGQGWLYGRPVTADHLPGLIAAPAHVTPPVVISPGDGWAVSSLEALPTQRLAQLQAIYDGAPVGLCFLDRDFHYISLNKMLAEMNGEPVSAHLGRTIQEMYPLWFPLYEPYLLRALAGESMSGIEIARPSQVPDQPGTLLLASYEPAWDEADEVIGISIAVVDITKYKRTEEALRESDDQRRHMIELTHQMPWIMDREGNNLESSCEWVEAAAWHKGIPRSLGWLEALRPDDLGPTMRIMKNALKTGQQIDIEYRVCVDGLWRWMRSRGSPRFGPSGEILRWYGVVEDIDEKKCSEERVFVG